MNSLFIKEISEQKDWHWMLSDRLLLNDDKTEFLLIGTRQQLNKVGPLPLELEQWIWNP